MNLKTTGLVLSLFFLRSLPCFALPMADSRDLALGGMAVADVNPSAAVFLNPAVLGGGENLEAAFTQSRLSISDFDFDLSASFPLVPKVLGLGFGWDAVANRNQVLRGIVRDQNGQVILDPTTGLPLTQVLGFFTQSINTFYLSLGAKMEFFSIGASAKFYLSDFGSFEGKGLGFDAGLRLDLQPNLFWGATLSDINDTLIDFSGATPNQKAPFTWATSLAWKCWSDSDFIVSLEPGASQGFSNGSAFIWGGGMEIGWHQSVFLRVGDNSNTSSFGVGLIAHPEKIFKAIHVDYTYLTQAPDGYPSRLTLTVDW